MLCLKSYISLQIPSKGSPLSKSSLRPLWLPKVFYRYGRNSGSGGAQQGNPLVFSKQTKQPTGIFNDHSQRYWKLLLIHADVHSINKEMCHSTIIEKLTGRMKLLFFFPQSPRTPFTLCFPWANIYSVESIYLLPQRWEVQICTTAQSNSSTSYTISWFGSSPRPGGLGSLSSASRGNRDTRVKSGPSTSKDTKAFHWWQTRSLPKGSAFPYALPFHWKTSRKRGQCMGVATS